MIVSSRIFGIQVNNIKTDGFVAYADMLNHKRPRQTSWTYSDEHGGFIIEANEDIPRGEQVYDSYGKKCNSRFFLNYGFINLNNDANEVPIKVFYNDDDQYLAMKKEMIPENINFRKFRVVENLDDRIMYEFFSWCRFVEFDENMAQMYEFKGQAQQAARGRRDDSDDSADDEESNKAFNGKRLPPISIKNERKVLLRVKQMAEEIYQQYETTLEEDYEVLKKDDEAAEDQKLSFNQRNCVLMRSGEKEILTFLVRAADSLVPMLDMDFKVSLGVFKPFCRLPGNTCRVCLILISTGSTSTLSSSTSSGSSSLERFYLII